MARSLAEWLALQEAAHPKSIDLGLARVGAVARRLGIDRPQCAVITVGGTNGKGSTVAHLEALWLAAGRSVGLFTSPHFLRYNERIRIDGVEAEDAAIVAAFERIEAARGATSLTFFEYNTLAALQLFREQGVELALLEVGLGGRLDATNLVAADVAVVCSVGFDHRDWLGDTLEEIGAEKAGIFRAGRPAVLGTPHMPSSVYAAIARLGAKPIVAERDFGWRVEPEPGEARAGATAAPASASPICRLRRSPARSSTATRPLRSPRSRRSRSTAGPPRRRRLSPRSMPRPSPRGCAACGSRAAFKSCPGRPSGSWTLRTTSPPPRCWPRSCGSGRVRAARSGWWAFWVTRMRRRSRGRCSRRWIVGSSAAWRVLAASARRSWRAAWSPSCATRFWPTR